MHPFHASRLLFCLTSLTALAGAGLFAPPRARAATPVLEASDVSFKYEIQRAIDRGLDWLKVSQDPAGHWSTADHPALTALALTAFQGDPSGRSKGKYPDAIAKGYEVLLRSVKADGGIHQEQLMNYNTSISMLALLAANNPDYDPIILQARKYVIAMQMDYGEKGETDSPLDGGIGYGSSYPHSDMANTLQALEALYHSRRLVEDTPKVESTDLDWGAAIHFLQNCQNLPSHNSGKWVSSDQANKGGFVYFPGNSKAGSITNSETGRVTLRSYGSISYAGLLSYVYADLKPDDPRVRAVFDWLRGNYTLKENPGMGYQGLYYYYFTMAKALTAFGVAELELTDGTKVDWRRELATKLINLQQADGSWINTGHGRWWEKDPALVTSYTLLTLEAIHHNL